LHELVECCAAKAASSGAGNVSAVPVGFVRLDVETVRSLDAVVAAEIRNSSRPGSRAPHAPPALTFGLPGKQRVKQVRADGILTRLLNTLP
jgi:hypothetical protein